MALKDKGSVVLVLLAYEYHSQGFVKSSSKHTIIGAIIFA